MTNGRPPLRTLAVATAALLLSLACGVSQGNTGGTTKTEVGVTKDTITIGTTTPLSGPASFYAPISKGANAYYQYVNALGGVNGRKISYTILDDSYDAAKAVPLTHQLVEQDQVFAVVGQLGTPINTATRPYLNEQRVPDIFVATGATKWGAEYKTFPWTIGLQPDYQSEARVYAKDIIKKHPNSAIGILYQNDDFGKDYVTGLTAGLGSNSSWIVATQSYEAGSPDVSSQVAALKDKGVNLLLMAAIPTQGISAMKTLSKLNWKPVVYITNVLNSTVNTRAVIAAGGGDNIDSMTSTFYGKDVNDPKWANDPVIAAYKKVLAQYCTPQPCDPTDITYATGMGGAWLFVTILKKLGRDGVTRDNLMKAVRSMSVKACADPNPESTDKVFLGDCDPWLFPGLQIRTGGDNQWPITQLAPATFSTAKGNWVIDYGNVISAR
jgi:ABC-type branched-subunit amino acid transport system substrate-binding protein